MRSMPRVDGEDLEENGAGGDDGVEDTDDENRRQSQSSGNFSISLMERSVGWGDGVLSGEGVDVGSAERKQQEFGGHREIQRFREIFWVLHVADEGWNERMSDPCERDEGQQEYGDG